MPLIEHLHDLEPFSTLPEPMLRELTGSVTEKTFPAGSWVFKEKQAATGFLYIIKKGLVEISVMTPGGVDMVVDYRKDGAFFGGTPVFTGEPYSAGAHAVKATDCYLIPEEILKRIESSAPQLSNYFTRVVLSRVRKLYSEIVSEHSSSAFTDMEAFPFQKRLSEIMTTPVTTCQREQSAQSIAQIMAKEDISALLVNDDSGGIEGIITECDLVRKVLATESSNNNSIPASQIMTAHPYSLPPDTYMFEAMSYMLGHRIKHLPVIAENEALGMVTLQDLMRYRSQKAMLLLGTISEKNNISDLAIIRKELVKVARSLLSETRSTPEAMEILSYIHHAIIKRAHDLCFDETVREYGAPPDARYCFLIMGSGGRREMLLNPDQDHAFVFDNVPDSRLEELNAFFIPFGDRLTDALNEIGYAYCDGGVMVNNPIWRGRLNDWQERIEQWIETPDSHNIRHSTIFFDLAPLAGDPSLAHDLRDIVNTTIAENPGFLYHMMTQDLRNKVPLGILGKFQVEKKSQHPGQLSLKNGGTVFLVDCIRMFALEEGLQDISTLKRLEELVKREVFTPDTAEHLRASYEALNYLRLRHEVALIEKGEVPEHFIDPYSLSKSEQDLLREAFHAVNKLQDATEIHFSYRPF